MQVGSGESVQNVSEKDILERVAGKFKAYLEGKTKPIMAAVKFDRRRDYEGRRLTPWLLILSWWPEVRT